MTNKKKAVKKDEQSSKTKVFFDGPASEQKDSSGLIIGSEEWRKKKDAENEKARIAAIEETEKKEKEEREQDIRNWKSAYQAWKNDDSRIKEFKETRQEILFKDDSPKVLVEAFLYYPEKGDSDIIGDENLYTGLEVGLTATQQSKLKSLPFVKVLWSKDEKEIGKIYSVADGLAQVKYNPDYDQWMAMRAEKPSMEGMGERPPRFKAGWAMWASHNYMVDKFKHDPDIIDYFTFLIPVGHLKTKSNL